MVLVPFVCMVVTSGQSNLFCFAARHVMFFCLFLLLEKLGTRLLFFLIFTRNETRPVVIKNVKIESSVC